MKGFSRFLSPLIHWTILSACLAFAVSGLANISRRSAGKGPITAGERRKHQEADDRAKGMGAIQRPRSGLVDLANPVTLDFSVLQNPETNNSKIVFASNRDGSIQIYVMNSDGSEQTRLTYSGASDDYPRWSPDGTKILFQSDRDNPETGFADVYVMNADGSGQTRLTTDTNDDSAAVWSPDGTKIAFQSARNGVSYQVYVMNADGSRQMNISNSGANDTQPSWSPGGMKIAFASDRVEADFSSVYLMNTDGSNQTRLTFSGNGFRDEQPAWSPNGTKLAFTSTRDSIVETWQETDDDGAIVTKSALHINKEIYVMNADGTNQTRFTNDLSNDDSPNWSPDGTRIIFRSERERDCCDPTAQVWLMNADGSNQTNLSNHEFGDYSASWTAPWSNQSPVANPGGPYNGDVGQAVEFNGGGSIDPDGTITSYSWNFGNGETGSGVISIHAYATTGTYTVTLTVTDNLGATANVTTTATITSSTNDQSATSDGLSSSPDSTARPVAINFDSLPTNTIVPVNQYQIAGFSSYAGGTISTAYDCHLGGSCPNGIVATSGYGYSYWPDADLYVNFSLPVSGLTFRILGSQAGGSSGLIEVYVNHSLYQSSWFSGQRGYPGQVMPPLLINLTGIQHVTGLVIRNVSNGDYWYYSNYALYYDDFTFTPELSVNLVNYRITSPQGALYVLNGTTQNALLAAEVFLETNVTPSDQGGGTYSWSVQGNPTITGGTSQSSIHMRWKEAGSYTVVLKYTKLGVTVTAGMTVNVVAPRLTSFYAYADPEQVTRDMQCSKSDQLSSNYASVTMGCWRGGQSPRSGIVFTAQAQIPSGIYLTEAGEAGIKIRQYIREFRKRINDLDKNGTFECEGHRDSSANLVPAWQSDGEEDISPFFGFPPKFYQDNISWTALDAPGTYLEGATISGKPFMHDSSFAEETFETYVDYFVGSDPYVPYFTMPLKLSTENTYKYSRISWHRNSLVVFDPSVATVKYRLVWSNSSQGNIPVTGTNELPPFQGNGNSIANEYKPCEGGPASSNKIDGARCYVKQLYWDFLNRAPDQEGWDFWLGQITQCAFDTSCIGYRRIQVAKAFFFSGEFIQTDPDMVNAPGSPNFNAAVYNRAFVRHCYNNFLRRQPDQAGWDFWTNVLNTNGNYNQIINAFILSGEYRDRPFALPGAQVNFINFHPCP